VSDLAQRYEFFRMDRRVRERPLIPLPRIPSELELQARWFAGEFGRQFRTTTGEQAEIVQFGFWNREAGPDFQDAAVRIGDAPVIKGAIEIDLVDRNWELHGHSRNPSFDETVLHVFPQRSSAEFFTRTNSNRNVPQIHLDLARLRDSDVANLPIAHAGRCVAPLKNLEASRVASVLEAAAQFRLHQKAERLRQRIEAHGRNETIYQSVAEALGYKQNRLPFTLLAQRLSLALLQKNRSDAEALLFGVAGFLEAHNLTEVRKSARPYLRTLWDRWWKHREQFARLILPSNLWKLGGGRPLNHPQRRLGALAALVAQWRKFSGVVATGPAAQVSLFLTTLQHEFWSKHYTLVAPGTAAPLALIGDARAADILANVIYPLAFGHGSDIWSDYKKLRAQLSNRAVKIAAVRLFADDPRQKQFLRTVAAQQGLLQIYEDFCLRDLSDCAACPFPERIRNWQ
jgi:Protein of unknown function (DUF2851).